MFRPATPLSVLLLAAFVLLLLSTISTPIIKAIPLATYNGVDFGVFGYCKGDQCSSIGVGYNTDGLFSNTENDFSLPSTSRRSLSSILIVHPIAAFLTLILLILSLTAHFHSPSHSPRYLLFLLILTLPTLLVSLLAFLVDILLFVPHMRWGGWIVLAATILIVASGIVSCAMRRTLVSRRAKRKRVAENAEMNGQNYYSNMQTSLARADSPPPLSGQSTAPLSGTSSNPDKLPQFATFDVEPKDRASTEDQRPLNPTVQSPPDNVGIAISPDGPVHAGPMPPPAGMRRGPSDPSLRAQTVSPSIYSNSSGGPPSGAGRGRGMYPPRGDYGRSPPPGAFRGPPPGYNGPPRGRGSPGPGPGPGPGPYQGPSPSPYGPPRGRGSPGAYPGPYPGPYGPPRGRGSPGPGQFPRMPSNGSVGPRGRGSPGPNGPYPPSGPYGPPPGPNGSFRQGPPPMLYGGIPGPRASPGPVMGPSDQKLALRRSPPPGLSPVGPGEGPVGQAIEMDAATSNPSFAGPGHQIVGGSGLSQGQRSSPLPRGGSPALPGPMPGALPEVEEPQVPPFLTAYIPPRAAWNRSRNASPSVPNVAPTPPPPIQPHEEALVQGPVELPASPPPMPVQDNPQHRRVGSSDDYYEDVDYRFVEPEAIPGGHMPSSLMPGYEIGPTVPVASQPDPNLAEHHSYEDLHEGARSPAASDISHFTSVSQRPVNPNWHPPPPPPNMMPPTRKPVQQREDVLLGGNPDFELPSRGRGRGARAAGPYPSGGGPYGSSNI
ncbi:pali-domain-containing protein [Xylona heveae TC161]|uniref:Pali-domain-containing protein n=1 Tax=Xylona heveae (strain CBS 132557 / TC161) TaxID=1328760 RepID=A0A165AG47_XYLHT|nr:pali-domain-containing protein [Xylona heveae TC161]KZF20420.1 pali-domain-containing protein [Xylona heveae TC161]